MTTTLQGRVAFVTGASAGIGAACARALAREGVAVGLAARRTDRLERLAEEIGVDGGRALALPLDVGRADDVAMAVAACAERFGRLDIVVANAGFGYVGTLEDTPTAVMERLMTVNFMGSFSTAQAALPFLRRQGAGHLLFVSSIAGRRGIQYLSAYSATKAAQIGLAEALRAELQGTGITVSVVLPVSTRSEFLDAIARDYGRHVTPYGPRQSAERVADMIVRTIRHPRAEIYPYAPARALPVLNCLAPGLCGWIVRRFGRRQE